MKKLVLLFAALLVAGCGEKSLSDSAIKKALEEAVELDSLLERGDLHYQVNESEPYSGWVKETYDSGQVAGLAQLKDGSLVGLLTRWHSNGQKQSETTFKDGEEVSAKYWNSKGEEVKTAEGAEAKHAQRQRENQEQAQQQEIQRLLYEKKAREKRSALEASKSKP